MDNGRKEDASGAEDKREIFSQLHEHSVAIASLQSGVESLASSMESGFRNVGNRLDDLVQTQRSSRPQLGLIATVFIAGCALVGGLAGFALKSSILPVAGAVASHAELQNRINEFYEKDIDSNAERIRELEISVAEARGMEDGHKQIIDLILADAVNRRLNEAHTHQAQ